MSNPVVTHQPGAGGYGTNVQTGDWSTGLCSCCSDCLVCEYHLICSHTVEVLAAERSSVNTSEEKILLSLGAVGFCCPIALSCYTANKYGENCCLGCLPGGMTAMRTHMRLTYGIQVHVQSLFLLRSYVYKRTAGALKRRQRFPCLRNIGCSVKLTNLNCNTFPSFENLVPVL